MNPGLLLLILLKVSQHASCVEVYEGEESVLLPCQVDASISERSTVVWSREELKQEQIHIRQVSGDDHGDQNKLYINRTWMRTDALQTGDLSLTLRKPTISDSGTYNCTVRRKGKLLSATEVELLVSVPFPLWLWIVAGVLAPLLLLVVFVCAVISLANKAIKDRLNNQLKTVEVTEGAGSVKLTCTTTADLSGNIMVEWRRSVPNYKLIHVYKNNRSHPEEGGRTQMKNNPLEVASDGQKDLSLTLKNPQVKDGGVYICTIYKNGELVRQKIVVLSVRETWIRTIRGLCTCCSKKSPAEQTAAVEKKEEAPETEGLTVQTNL